MAVRIHRNELRIRIDVLVENVDEAGEGVMSADGLEDGAVSCLRHHSILHWGVFLYVLRISWSLGSGEGFSESGSAAGAIASSLAGRVRRTVSCTIPI